MRLIDRTGQRYERLVVVSRAPNKGGKDTNARWLCKCDCGSVLTAYGQDLARGKVKSCGCYNAERILKHGMSRSSVYRIWIAMVQRCENPNANGYDRYGGAGVTVCEEWKDFETFLKDMGHRPKGYSIDRIDNSKGYSKGNCRWATTAQQNNNRRVNRNVTINGETKTIAEWAKEYGVTWQVMKGRIQRGWSEVEAVSTPVGSKPQQLSKEKSK